MFCEKITCRINRDFDSRFSKAAMPPDLEKVLASVESDEALCLKFYYAYMPASDIASYSVDLFLQIIRHALFVREQNIFGENIPEEVFVNFVLQYRSNNENLEYNRDYFYKELFDRVKGKTAEQAAVEVNYWCLEKVTYIGTNIRTMSPFTLIKNTVGRCGEESVFTVSALRSIGIPARQVYTPRWAHCDSNHAWVEAYVGGKWQFLGACEPEPVLNKGWFTGPAAKGMLIYTKLFSPIATTDEELAYTKPTFCEINLTKNYVQHHTKLRIIVENANSNVRVHLQVVNGCELYSIITLSPDEKGEVAATIGKGHVYLHITDGKKFICHIVDAGKENDIKVDFAKAVDHENGQRSFVTAAPFCDYQDPDYGLSGADIKAHEEKTAACHALRKAYADTFAGEEKGREIAKRLGLEPFDGHNFFVGAKGNVDEIVKFLEQPVYCGSEAIPVKYKAMVLRSLQEKDLTDCEAAVLAEHLSFAYPFRNDYYDDVFEKYVLCPRAEIEMITAYRKAVSDFFDAQTRKAFAQNPLLVWQWVEEHVKEGPEYKTGNDHRFLSAFPAGLLRYPYGGLHSRKILFVAICRTLGVPARFNQNDGDLEYFTAGKFAKVVQVKEQPVTYTLTVKEKNAEPLRYWENFTIAKLDNGTYTTLDFRGDIFKVEPGYYRLLTGRRLESTAMSVQSLYVDVQGDTDAEVEMPEDQPVVLEPKPVADFDFGGKTLHKMLSGRDMVAFIQPSNEPTEHLLKELLDTREDYKKQGVRVLLVSCSENDTLQKVKTAFGDDISVVRTQDDAFARHLAQQTGQSGTQRPVIAYIGANALALYYSQGYHVGSVSRALVYAKQQQE